MAENSKEPDRLSLHGMTPEHALRKALGTPPQKRDDAAIDRLAKAFSQFSETGESPRLVTGAAIRSNSSAWRTIFTKAAAGAGNSTTPCAGFRHQSP